MESKTSQRPIYSLNIYLTTFLNAEYEFVIITNPKLFPVYLRNSVEFGQVKRQHTLAAPTCRSSFFEFFYLMYPKKSISISLSKNIDVSVLHFDYQQH